MGINMICLIAVILMCLLVGCSAPQPKYSTAVVIDKAHETKDSNWRTGTEYWVLKVKVLNNARFTGVYNALCSEVQFEQLSKFDTIEVQIIPGLLSSTTDVIVVPQK